MTKTGGLGGFFASVLDIGVVQPPGIKVSADEAVLGGAGGILGFNGGGTNPGSSDPSDAKTVPAHNVATKSGSVYFFIIFPFYMCNVHRRE